MEQNMSKIRSSIKLYPTFYALSADLIFFVPIDTLFLTLVKGLNARFANMYIITKNNSKSNKKNRKCKLNKIRSINAIHIISNFNIWKIFYFIDNI